MKELLKMAATPSGAPVLMTKHDGDNTDMGHVQSLWLYTAADMLPDATLLTPHYADTFFCWFHY